MIISSAIMIGGAIISMPKPARHADILRQIMGLYGPDGRPDWTYDEEVQGFLTNDGQFLNRRKAFQHVHECGQGTPNRRTSPGNYQGEELYSEDLW